jgi:hypothetical protein
MSSSHHYQTIGYYEEYYGTIITGLQVVDTKQQTNKPTNRHIPGFLIQRNKSKTRLLGYKEGVQTLRVRHQEFSWLTNSRQT